MLFTYQKSDTLGVTTSVVCLVHCVITPFIFIAQTNSVVGCESTPFWWKILDYIFLVISFLAVYRSIKTTSSNWIKPAMWGSWLLLFIVIINEKLQLLPLSETIIYIPTVALIILHQYNKKYCKCDINKCCINEE